MELGPLAPGYPGASEDGHRNPKPSGWCRVDGAAGVSYCGWTKTVSHHFEAMGNENGCWYLQGNQIIPGFVRWCKISSIHSMVCRTANWTPTPFWGPLYYWHLPGVTHQVSDLCKTPNLKQKPEHPKSMNIFFCVPTASRISSCKG